MATGKKRLNPETGKPFRRGDVREDGRIFHSYKTSRTNKDGYFSENWYLESSLTEELSSQSLKQKQRRASYKKKPNPKRLNPKTQQPFRKGDTSNGKIFWGYTAQNLVNGFVGELWVKKDDYFRKTIQATTLGNARRRARDLGLPCDLDLDYLLSIFPDPPICPVLGIKMYFGKDNEESNKSSPSLDRIFPKKGYIKGNVIFISGYANMIKQDASSEQIFKVAKWLKKQESK